MNDQALLLDTHCWIWAQLGLTDNLSGTALRAIRSAESRGQLQVSVISIWEVGMLERKGRVTLPRSIGAWVQEALASPGISLAHLTAEIAIESVSLPGDLRGDPADRMIVATARTLGATLLTKDRRLIEYSRLRHVRVLAA